MPHEPQVMSPEQLANHAKAIQLATSHDYDRLMTVMLERCWPSIEAQMS